MWQAWERKVYKVWWESPKEIDHLEVKGEDGGVWDQNGL
jgi:hypothetical protein